MVTALRTFLVGVFAPIWQQPGEKNRPTLGAYPVDYEEPTQSEIDEANRSCADALSEGNWISVNRKS